MTVTATEAARNFSDLLNRARYQGESFEIIRGGEVVARVVPPAAGRRATLGELLAVLEALPPADERFADDLEQIQRSITAPPEDRWAS